MVELVKMISDLQFVPGLKMLLETGPMMTCMVDMYVTDYHC